jgi:hypothetical protein
VEDSDSGAWISTDWLKAGTSIVRRNSIDTDAPSDWMMTHSPTMGSPNIISAPPSTEESSRNRKVYDPVPIGDLRIFRILPYPTGKESENEQIILKNMSNKPINFAQLTISDASFKRSFLPAYTLLPQDEITLYARFFGINLQNSGGSLFLYNTDGEILDFVTYPELAQGDWYVYNDQQGKWGVYSSTVVQQQVVAQDFTISGYMYVGDELTFSCSGCNNAVYWEFGDGVAGYGTEVSHSYADAGEYYVQMLQNGSHVLSKKILIQKQPQSTLRFVEILPDPLGPDKDHEYIVLENTGDEALDTSLYAIYSEATESLCFFASHQLLGGGRLQVNPAEIGCSLRNSKDTLVLYDHFKRVHDSITYSKTQPGEVIYAQKTEIPLTAIKGKEGDGLMLLGRIMIPPGIMGKKSFILCDAPISCYHIESTYDLNIVDGSIIQLEVIDNDGKYKHYKRHFAQLLPENFLPEFTASAFEPDIFGLVQLSGMVISEGKNSVMLGAAHGEYEVIWTQGGGAYSMLGQEVAVLGVYSPNNQMFYARTITPVEKSSQDDMVIHTSVDQGLAGYMQFIPLGALLAFLCGVLYLKYA